jgi:2-polyprenyl-3-methyl-5-hydroxy-6-metoxy-1,4-benzoquinol methylase
LKPPHKHYPDYANPELLDKIPLNARTVLDVGCAQGALGAAYMRRNPNCRMLGIDVDEEAVALASQRLTEAVCADVERTPMPFKVPEGIDCIIYGDVLEHLVDPWALLAEHVKYLSPQGTVLVCMPNVEHWSFAAKLLTGTFDYEEQGLFDKTHLRWFTPRTMGKLLASAGLALADIAPRPINTQQAEQFVQALAPGLKAIGVEPQEFLNRAAPLQFLWRARKVQLGNIEVTATMLAPQGGVSDVRVVEPMRALGSDSRMVAKVSPEEAIEPAAEIPRIAIIHRPLLNGAAGKQRIRRLLDKGYLVVTEFDDHPVFMEERGLDVHQMLTFRGVHAVQTSTMPLAEVLVADNPEVAVFPNGVFELPAVHNFADPEQMTFFFGALNRQADWAEYMPVLNEVARAVGPRLRFQVLYDNAFYNALETTHKSFEPLADYTTYKKLLCQAEISFMPLGDSVFNRAKSDLKFIEAGAARVAALANPTVYGSVIEDGKTGLIFRNPAELRSSLLRLLAYPEATKRVAQAARDYVSSKRMLAYQVDARIKWYHSLWARRDELNEALTARAPELFT